MDHIFSLFFYLFLAHICLLTLAFIMCLYPFLLSSPESWYHFNDSTVTETNSDYVANSRAYILFYVKRDQNSRYYNHSQSSTKQPRKIPSAKQSRTASTNSRVCKTGQSWE